MLYVFYLLGPWVKGLNIVNFKSNSTRLKSSNFTRKISTDRSRTHAVIFKFAFDESHIINREYLANKLWNRLGEGYLYTWSMHIVLRDGHILTENLHFSFLGINGIHVLLDEVSHELHKYDNISHIYLNFTLLDMYFITSTEYIEEYLETWFYPDENSFVEILYKIDEDGETINFVDAIPNHICLKDPNWVFCLVNKQYILAFNASKYSAEEYLFSFDGQVITHNIDNYKTK